MELDDDSGASSDYSLLGRMYKSKSLPGPGMETLLYKKNIFEAKKFWGNYQFIVMFIVYVPVSILSSL